MNTFIRLNGNRSIKTLCITALIAPPLLLFTSHSFSGDISLLPSQQSPIIINETPMFISLGFDDNVDPDGLDWVLQLLQSKTNPKGADTFANKPLSASFFMHCGPARGNETVITRWRQAKNEGHDIGSHTETHPDDKINWDPLNSWMSEQQWQQEIALCNELLMAPESQGGVGVSHVSGFRAPYLTYNDNTLNALVNNDIQYDVSFPAGIETKHDGTNNYWPHTLENGSPEHNIATNGGWKPQISNYENLWEVPLHTLIVPPDSAMEEFGLPYSLRDKIAARVPWFDAVSGKTDSFDWNLYSDPTFGASGLNENDVVAIYTYNLDLRINNNKAPLVIGLHSGFYGYLEGQEHIGMPESTVTSRQRVLERFIDYALSKSEVRFINHKQLIDWMVSPEALTLCPTAEWKVDSTYTKGSRITYQNKNYEAAWWTTQQIPGLYENSPWNIMGDCTTPTLN